MGNKSSNVAINLVDYHPPDEKKFAKSYELRSDTIPCPKHIVKKFIGYGYTKEEAMEDFKKVSRENGLPEISVTHNGKMACGTIIIAYSTCEKERYNPLYHVERNGRHAYYA